MWQLGPIWKATWRPKYDSRPEIDYNLLFRWFVGLATDDAGVEPRGVFTARVDARKVKDCPKTRGEGPRCEVEDGVLGLQFEAAPQAFQGLGQEHCAEQGGRAALGRPVRGEGERAIRRLRFFGTLRNVEQRGATSPTNIPLRFQELAI